MSNEKNQLKRLKPLLDGSLLREVVKKINWERDDPEEVLRRGKKFINLVREHIGKFKGKHLKGSLAAILYFSSRLTKKEAGQYCGCTQPSVRNAETVFLEIFSRLPEGSRPEVSETGPTEEERNQKVKIAQEKQRDRVREYGKKRRANMTEEQRTEAKAKDRKRRLEGLKKVRLERIGRKLEFACNKLSLRPEHRELAFAYLREILENDDGSVFRNSTRDVYSVTAIIYLAYREAGTPASLNWIRNGLWSTGGTHTKVSRSSRVMVGKFQQLLGLVTPTTIEGWVDYISNRLGLDDQFRKLVNERTKALYGSSTTQGKPPSRLAASLVYLTSFQNGHKLTQREVAGAAGTTEVTIRNYCKKFFPKITLPTIRSTEGGI